MAAIEMPIDRIATDDDWMREGACRGLTHLFFPPAAERPQARERREAGAKQVCASCTVRTDCMDFAREHHEYGFWGGESEDERHAAGFRLIAPIGVQGTAARQLERRRDVFDVVVVGSANLDLVVRAARIPGAGETLLGDSYDEYPGGKGLNQAVAAARSGASVAFVGAFGDDEAGARLRGVAGHDGIDTTRTPSIDSTPTGRALITVGGDGENTIVVVPGANARVIAADAPAGRGRAGAARDPHRDGDRCLRRRQATGSDDDPESCAGHSPARTNSWRSPM